MKAGPFSVAAGLPDAVTSLLERWTAARPASRARLCAVRAERDPEVILAEAGDAPAVGEPVWRGMVDPAGDPMVELAVWGAADAGSVEFLAAALGQAFEYEREARAAARELSERYEEINLLYSISEILGSVLALPDAARRILSEVADVLGARRASLWVYDAVAHELRLAAAVGEDGMAGPIAPDDPYSATAWVFRERQALNLERGSALRRGTRLEPRPHGREAFLSVPVSYTPPEGENRVVGVITLVGRRNDVRFSAGDARLLSAVASQVGAALETQRLVQESLVRERLEREVELAHHLQMKLLPQAAQFPGPGEVAARCDPAELVGGDFYNLFRLPGERLGVVIGDVSSHGFSAALIMALTMSAVGIYAQEAGSPAEALRHVHAALIRELETTEMYLSLFFGIIDPAAGRLLYANAGHPQAFLVRQDGEAVRLGATSPPLGVIPLAQYGDGVVAWNRGRDLLCLFTDGLSDGCSPEGGVRGEAALLAEVRRLRDRPVQQILSAVFKLAARGRPGIPPDDRTAVLARV